MQPKAKGGMPDMGDMLAQVQQMQADMQATQEALGDETVEATVGGGIVKVVVTCNQEVVAVEIDPDAVDPDDVDMLQDLIVAGVNEALRLAKQTAEERMGSITGGLDLGGLGAGLGLDLGGLMGS
ncbi:MAG: YbaB/EbfC family nucleoid-associated protein [Acidimicrobiia bacterium]|nr:YbaB/EbfC family nucleoid-associated protein [Acidimicrobiia bacterium]